MNNDEKTVVRPVFAMAYVDAPRAHTNRADELFKSYRDQQKRTRGRIFRNLLILSLVLHSSIALGVAFVPGVRNALAMANMFSGAEFADEDYKRTKINAANANLEVVAVVNANDLMQYPAGYFLPFHGTQSSPEMAAQIEDAQVIAAAPPQNYSLPPLLVPFTAPQPRPTILPTPKPLPKTSTRANEKVANLNGNTNSEVAKDAASKNTSNSKNANSGNTNGLASADNTNTEKTADEKAAEAEKARAELGFPKINARPFKDLLTQGKTLYDAGKIDLSKDVDVELEAMRQPDGSLTDVTILRSNNSEEAKQLALAFVAALSDSNVLSRLQGMTLLNMKVNVNKDKVAAIITSDMESKEQAQKINAGMSALLFGAILKQEGGTEAVQIYKNIKLSAKDKQVIVNFEMPRADAGMLITNQLAKKDEPPKTEP